MMHQSRSCRLAELLVTYAGGRRLIPSDMQRGIVWRLTETLLARHVISQWIAALCAHLRPLTEDSSPLAPTYWLPSPEATAKKLRATRRFEYRELDVGPFEGMTRSVKRKPLMALMMNR